MKNRPITFEPEIEEIIQKCDHCNVAMVDAEGKPYLVPMNFGYHKRTLYIHSAPEGKKIELLKANPEVCVSFSTDHVLRWQDSTVGCSYSMKYRSVLLYGSVEFIEDFDEKEAILHVIMKQYKAENYKFGAPAIKNVCVMRIKASKLEGRAYGY